MIKWINTFLRRMSSYFFACCQTNPSKELIIYIYIYIEYQFPFEIIFKHETFPAITNNNADANQNGNIPRMEKSAQPFLFVSCYFLSPTSTGRGGWNFLDRGSPRERQANNSKQLSVLTEQWVRLLNPAVIYAYRGAVCRFPICAFTRRLCAGRTTPVCKSFQTPRRGKTATEICILPQTVHPLHIPKDMKT